MISEVRVGPGVKRKKLKAKVQDNTFEMMEIDSLSLSFFLHLFTYFSVPGLSCSTQDI